LARDWYERLGESKEKYFLTKADQEDIEKSVELPRILDVLRQEKIVGKGDSWDKFHSIDPRKVMPKAIRAGLAFMRF